MSSRYGSGAKNIALISTAVVRQEIPVQNIISMLPLYMRSSNRSNNHRWGLTVEKPLCHEFLLSSRTVFCNFFFLLLMGARKCQLIVSSIFIRLFESDAEPGDFAVSLQYFFHPLFFLKTVFCQARFVNYLATFSENREAGG